MKYDEGVAALNAARDHLGPLLTPRNAGDEVYRALPSGPEWTWRISRDEALLKTYMEVYGQFSAAAVVGRRRFLQRTVMVMGSSAVGFAVPVATSWTTKDGFVGNATSFIAALSMFGLMGSLAMLFCFAVACLDRHSKSVVKTFSSIQSADLTGLVEVVNPDEATALALDRAKSHTTTAEGAPLVRARQHYYDLLVEVRNGTAGTVAGSRDEQWAAVWRRWCAVDDAWTDLMCDPFAALTHSELLDVTLPRTAAFITAYAEARDVMTGRTAATTPADLTRLARLVDTTVTAWTEARDHAEHAGYAWLPETERKIAQKAEKLLALAGDSSAPLGERSTAATAAGRLLAQITTVRLPEKARAELDHLSRKALPAPASILLPEQATFEQSVLILAPVRDAVPV